MNTKHWNLIQGFALTALLPLFAACSSEGDELLQGEEKQPVQVNITRAATDGNDWSWQDNDQIKMSITPHNGTATEYILTYQNGNWSNTALDEMVLPATAEAWWPSTASASEFSFQHDNQVEAIYHTDIPTWLDGTVDQSSMSKLAQNDWMTSGQITIGNPSIDLTLQHRLAKVTVTITSSETINEVRFFSYTPNTPTSVSSGNSSYLAVIPLVTNNTYTAIVSAFYYNNDIGYLPFMRVKVGENNAEKWVYLPRTLGIQGNLSAGNAYTFNLTVNNTSTRSTDTQECELELVDVEDMNK